MKKKLTIFTPTYNREVLLKKAYKSLLEQTSKDFIWLIIDDGSDDNTKSQVEEWIKENKINISYYIKKNGGKHTAYNYAIDVCKTEYIFLSLDSDDEIYSKNTVRQILDELTKISGNEQGIITLCNSSRKDENNTFVKKYDIKKLKGKTIKEAYTCNLCNAECRYILKTKLLKNYKYPEIENERFFTEAFVYYQLNVPVVWTNISTCFSKYLEDGLTSNTPKLFVKNPNSWFLYNQLRMKENKSIIKKIKFLIYYISFGILSKRKIFNKGLCNILIAIFYPIGYLGSIYLKKKGNM